MSSQAEDPFAWINQPPVYLFILMLTHDHLSHKNFSLMPQESMTRMRFFADLPLLPVLFLLPLPLQLKLK